MALTQSLFHNNLHNGDFSVKACQLLVSSRIAPWVLLLGLAPPRAPSNRTAVSHPKKQVSRVWRAWLRVGRGRGKGPFGKTNADRGSPFGQQAGPGQPAGKATAEMSRGAWVRVISINDFVAGMNHTCTPSASDLTNNVCFQTHSFVSAEYACVTPDFTC